MSEEETTVTFDRYIGMQYDDAEQKAYIDIHRTTAIPPATSTVA